MPEPRKVRCPKCTTLLTEPGESVYSCGVCSTLLLAKNVASKNRLVDENLRFGNETAYVFESERSPNCWDESSPESEGPRRGGGVSTVEVWPRKRNLSEAATSTTDSFPCSDFDRDSQRFDQLSDCSLDATSSPIDLSPSPTKSLGILSPSKATAEALCSKQNGRDNAITTQKTSDALSPELKMKKTERAYPLPPTEFISSENASTRSTITHTGIAERSNMWSESGEENGNIVLKQAALDLSNANWPSGINQSHNSDNGVHLEEKSARNGNTLCESAENPLLSNASLSLSFSSFHIPKPSEDMGSNQGRHPTERQKRDGASPEKHEYDIQRVRERLLMKGSVGGIFLSLGRSDSTSSFQDDSDIPEDASEKSEQVKGSSSVISRKDSGKNEENCQQACEYRSDAEKAEEVENANGANSSDSANYTSLSFEIFAQHGNGHPKASVSAIGDSQMEFLSDVKLRESFEGKKISNELKDKDDEPVVDPKQERIAFNGVSDDIHDALLDQVHSPGKHYQIGDDGCRSENKRPLLRESKEDQLDSLNHSKLVDGNTSEERDKQWRRGIGLPSSTAYSLPPSESHPSEHASLQNRLHDMQGRNASLEREPPPGMGMGRVSQYNNSDFRANMIAKEAKRLHQRIPPALEFAQSSIAVAESSSPHRRSFPTQASALAPSPSPPSALMGIPPQPMYDHLVNAYPQHSPHYPVCSHCIPQMHMEHQHPLALHGATHHYLPQMYNSSHHPPPGAYLGSLQPPLSHQYWPPYTSQHLHPSLSTHPYLSPHMASIYHHPDVAMSLGNERLELGADRYSLPVNLAHRKQRKRYPPLPKDGAAPFVLCRHCFKLLEVPSHLSPTTGVLRKLRCGGCMKVLKFSVNGFGEADVHRRDERLDPLLENRRSSSLANNSSMLYSTASPLVGSDSMSGSVSQSWVPPHGRKGGAYNHDVRRNEMPNQPYYGNRRNDPYYLDAKRRESFLGSDDFERPYPSQSSSTSEDPQNSWQGVSENRSSFGQSQIGNMVQINRGDDELLIPEQSFRQKFDFCQDQYRQNDAFDEGCHVGAGSSRHESFRRQNPAQNTPKPHSKGSTSQQMEHIDYPTGLSRNDKLAAHPSSTLEHEEELLCYGSPCSEGLSRDGSSNGRSATTRSPAPGSPLYEHLSYDDPSSDFDVSSLTKDSPRVTGANYRRVSVDGNRKSKGSSNMSLTGFLRRSLKDMTITKGSQGSSSSPSRRVVVNGQMIPEDSIRKAEERAGPIGSGSYWYDYHAGFWGVMGGACSGIIPPMIEEFQYPMSRGCTGSSTTGVLVNGRELHQNDLDILAKRGLPTTPGRAYIIDISGRVEDETTGQLLKSLGKLAPSIEKTGRGYGMFQSLNNGSSAS